MCTSGSHPPLTLELHGRDTRCAEQVRDVRGPYKLRDQECWVAGTLQ
jgi:hypothetical protein